MLPKYFLGGIMVKFVSPHGSLRLVVKPASKSIVDGRIIAHMGKSIQFVGGIYTTEDKKEIDFIRGHNRFGTSVFEIVEEDMGLIKERLRLPQAPEIITEGEPIKPKFKKKK